MVNSLVSIRDLSDAGVRALFVLADRFAASGRSPLDLAHGKVLATLFYEPSTRTRMSFEAAMLRLGGQVISMADPAGSSAAKGETVADTVRIVASYADIIALRHPREGAARVAADFAGVPVINAGDGAREHPSQTLLDLYTIYREKGRIEGVTVALCGDLKHGRTVHSLVQGLARFGARVICIAPPELELPEPLVRSLAARYGLEIVHYPTLESAPLGMCDALYVTRIQRERFYDPLDFERVRASYQVSRATLTHLRDDAIVLHPLPRVDELDFSLDGDPRAAYFRQAAYGVPVRMALLATLLRVVEMPPIWTNGDAGDGYALLSEQVLFHCDNPRCITYAEPGLPAQAMTLGNVQRCAYCDSEQEIACPTC
jgi:aspartate carbamoyltransferase catalytic subunit